MNIYQNRHARIGVILMVIDWLTFNAAFWVCGLLWVWPYTHDTDQFLRLYLVGNVSYLIAQQFISITLHQWRSRLATVLRNSFNTTLLYVVLNNSILGMVHTGALGFWRALLYWLILFIFIVTERLVLHYYMKRHRYRSLQRTNAVILGLAGQAQRVVDQMMQTWSGFNLLGYFTDRDNAVLYNKQGESEVERLGSIADFVDYLEDHKVEEVYIGMRDSAPQQIRRVMAACDKHMVRVFFLPSEGDWGLRAMEACEFGDAYVMSLYNEPLRSARNRFIKRTFDIVFSLLVLCSIFIPVLIVVAIITTITMPGPIFFRQARTGYDGRTFFCLKFRSMKVNKQADTLQATRGDSRITKWGGFMRHTNIDELPQFINVLIGDMSVVGPRPHMLAHTEYYSRRISDYMIRHYIRPGITGWAQVNGERGETRDVSDMERRVEKDIWYIEHWNFWLDIQIIFKTVANVFKGQKEAF